MYMVQCTCTCVQLHVHVYNVHVYLPNMPFCPLLAPPGGPPVLSPSSSLVHGPHDNLARVELAVLEGLSYWSSYYNLCSYLLE